MTAVASDLEAFRMVLYNRPENMSIEYQVYPADQSWQDWRQNGDLSEGSAEGKVYFGLGIDGPAVGIEDGTKVAFAQLEPGKKHRGTGDQQEDSEHTQRH